MSTQNRDGKSRRRALAGSRLDIAVAIAALLGGAFLAALLGGACIAFAAPAAGDLLPRRTGPYETIAGRMVEYGSVVTARGHRVRTVTSRPPAMPGRLPAIVFVPWLSCDTVEAPHGPRDGWSRMLNGVAAGVDAVFVRVDKPGVGDSEGDCSQTSLEDDLAAYRAAIRTALARPDVDPSRLVLFGGSIGGALAPVLAREFDVHAIAVAGGFSRTWSEHMLGHERRRLTLSGGAPGAVNAAMRGFVDFYALYLDARLTPGQVLAQRPDFKPLWYDEPEHQYGRHARYFHEVQALNVEGAWDAVRVPTLVVWGEFDWIMGRADQERIVEIVNAHAPGLARLAVISGMNHHFERFADPVAAFRERGGVYAADATKLIVDWLREATR